MGIKHVSCRFCCQVMQSRAVQRLPRGRVSDWRCRQSTNSVQKDGKYGSNRGRKRVIIQGEVGQLPGKGASRWHQHRRYQVWIYIDSELTSLGDTTATTIHSLWQSLYLVSPPGDVHQRHTRYFSYTPSEIPITLHHTELGTHQQDGRSVLTRRDLRSRRYNTC
jgi:hypothetical protein